MYNFNEYKIEVFFDEDDQEYGAFIKEIPSLSAYGKNYNEAIDNLKLVFEDYVEIQEEDGDPIPSPFGEQDFSGKFIVRGPKTLHRLLTEKANEDGVSLNQEVIFCMTRGLGMSA